MGAYLTIAPSYAAEVCPVQLRDISTSGMNLFMGLGEFLANAVISACGGSSSASARTLDAERSLQKVGYSNVHGTLAMFRAGVEAEKNEAKAASCLACFRGTDLRCTEIAIGAFAASQLVGYLFVIGYSSYFFELADLSSSSAFSLGIRVGDLGIVGSIGSWILINGRHAGRRRAFLYGTAALIFCLLMIGILDAVPSHGSGSVWGQSARVSVEQSDNWLI
ncbi:hypothetical protein BJ546DRAFT_1064345 [Cryomyces antarcticus]